MGTSLRHTSALRFSPAGLSDALDETDVFPGACAALGNLIPDPTTKDVWTCRPAASVLTSFAGFNTPTSISVIQQIGALCYGLIGSARNPGYDEPFVYNLLTSAFVTVAGITSATVPLTPATVGDWIPPTMSLVGVNLVVTHPGFDGVTNFIGWFDTSNPAAPVWHAGNLLPTGGVEAVGTLVGGAAYTAGTYLNVPLTGGAGSGLTADITVSGGSVTSVALRQYGTGYLVNDTLSALAANIGGTGAGFSIKVTAIAAGKIALTSVPWWVESFNGRAYLGVNPPGGQPAVIFTDSLVLTCSNANQVLTFGDNVPLTAATGLPLNNQLGGVVQALLVFKSTDNIYQVTGDAATNTLAINTLNVATGTLSPNTVVGTPSGVAFLAVDGVRLIDFSGHVSDPLGAGGMGVAVPFYSPLYPSRAVAACNASVLRVSLQTSQAPGTPFQDYWYDLVRKVWSGPHSLSAATMSVYAQSFVFSAVGVPAKLFLGSTVPSFTSGSVENGVQMTFNFQTTMLMDNEDMSQSEISELQVKTSIVAGMAGFTLSAIDENNSVYSSAFYAFNVQVTLWGSLVWGGGLWGGAQLQLYPRRIDFPAPVVYNRLALSITGPCAQGFRIGDFYLRRRVLGYLQGAP